MPDRYLERSFPIVQVNPLSVRERNAFKPVYTMHKWFARRSASIFRTILLGAALPFEGTDIMREFYSPHGEDPRLRRPDGRPLRVLDPFMGGGTTVVEALRLGFEVVGVDYNPVAWFIVRGETAPVDLSKLDAAFQRLSAKVKEELLALYRTECPLTGQEADIIYAFWVKQGICVDPTCGKATDLFKNYEVARKRGDATLRYFPDVECPACHLTFDWEIERCTITAGGPQVLGERPHGKSRPADTPFAFGLEEEALCCPHCQAAVPMVAGKPKSKTVPLHVLYDPSTGDFFEVRGDIPKEVTAPSGYRYHPEQGPVLSAGKFACAHCGRKQAIVEAADALGRALPFRCYGFYAYTAASADPSRSKEARRLGLPTNNHKWFGAAKAADLAKIVEAEARLGPIRHRLPLPEQEIIDGYNTNRLVIHHYKHWSELYGPRQLLALGLLLKAIGEEEDAECRDALLGAFQSHLDSVSNIVRYDVTTNKISGVTSAHDYRNPTTIAEVNVFGVGAGIGRGPFINSFEKYREGIAYRLEPDLTAADKGSIPVNDVVPKHWKPSLHRGSSTDLSFLEDQSIDLCITDPPYAGSVQYAEMSDWSYVWLHQILKKHYPDQFGAEITLKSQEIIEDGKHKDAAFFFENLAEVWKEVYRVLRDEGLLVFTFHHKEGDRWTGLLKALFDGGFYLVAAYPTHSEALNSIVIQATQGITYDIVHVCRKRVGAPEEIPWARLRREVQREARQQLREIEDGKDVLPGPDVEMILIGKALLHFSRHYGKVVDADGSRLDLDVAMDRIKVLVREVRGETLPLPAVLAGVDGLSQVALLHVVGQEGWSRDGLHIELRGYAQGLEELLELGLVREKGKGELEPVPALERYAARKESLDARSEGPLMDKLHLVLGTLHTGLPLGPLLKRWRGQWGLLREALDYLGKKDEKLRDLIGMADRAIQAEGPDEAPAPKAQQLGLFGGGI
jgi:putative DNA methylase